MSTTVPSSICRPEVVPLGRGRDGRRDAGDAVGEAGAGCADTVRGVDSGGSAEARGVSRSALRQERVGGAARRERNDLRVSTKPDATAGQNVDDSMLTASVKAKLTEIAAARLKCSPD